MRDEKYMEILETSVNLTEYYSEETGRDVTFGFDNEYELWVDAPRTNGKEYFETYEAGEERVRLLYPDVFLDDDYSDPIPEF
jgi:hypothetical protein